MVLLFLKIMPMWPGPGAVTLFSTTGFSDNGIGLTPASDGTIPADDGSSSEVMHSIFVGENINFGSQGGQNSYWEKGANGEYRTLPRNKTFPVCGFQIHDGTIRMERCTFKKLTWTVDKYSSAIGFFMENSWQISPQNNVPQILTEKGVGLKVFSGRPSWWFGNNDNDGDKMSIFHGLDGSGRDILTVPSGMGRCVWKICTALYPGQKPQELDLVRCQSSIPFPSHGATFQQCQPVVTLEQDYIIQGDGRAPEEVMLYPINFTGCYHQHTLSSV